jgi:hypothetical protein
MIKNWLYNNSDVGYYFILLISNFILQGGHLTAYCKFFSQRVRAIHYPRYLTLGAFGFVVYLTGK